MENNSTALQQEVERLNIIISALAEQNRQLRTENSLLKQTTNTGDKTASAFTGNNKGISNIPSASTGNNNGISNMPPASAGNINGVRDMPPASTGNINGVSNITSAAIENIKGVSNINIALVKNELRKHLLKRSYATIDRAAKVIMLLYENPKQHQKTLKHLTGLSDDGIIKHIAMLKRKGLIIRTAYQTYMLTQTSINIIKEAMQQ